MKRKVQFYTILSICLMTFSGVYLTNMIVNDTSNTGIDQLRSITTSGDDVFSRTVDSPVFDYDTSISKIDPVLTSWIDTGVRPANLLRYGSRTSIMLLTFNNPTLNGLITPLGSFKFGDFNLYWVHTTIKDVRELSILEAHPDVLRITPDFTNIKNVKSPHTPGVDLTDFGIKQDKLEASNVGVGPEPDNFASREILGSNFVQSTYGYNGSGTMVNIHDTGIDYGHAALSGTLAEKADGSSAAFDGTGGYLAVTNQYSETIYTEMGETAKAANFSGPLHTDANGMLDTSAYNDLLVWSAVHWDWFSLESDLGFELPSLYNATGIPGNNTGYYFGIAMQHNSVIFNFVPFLSADTTGDGFYDSIYIDWQTGREMTSNFEGLTSYDFYLNNSTFSFADSPQYNNTGNMVLSHDWLNPDGSIGTDGFPDLSIGAFANTYDAFNVTGSLTGSDNPMINSIMDDGFGFAFMYDYYGHGTLVGGSISARDIEYPLQKNSTDYSLQGVAPGTSLLATSGLLSDTADIYSYLWIQGYEPDVSGAWNFANDHVANISSNSWGYNSFYSIYGDSFVYGYDFVSLFIELLTYPGFISPQHPGILYVISSGNSGPGYSTHGAPTSPTAVIVGASTNNWFRENYNSDDLWGPSQGFDDISGFSSPGPTTTAYPKVDVVNIGAWDYSTMPVVPFAMDLGPSQFSGSDASYQLWGGTSQSAPYTSAILSIIYEAWLDDRGTDLQPDGAKTILKSSAVDLGYDVFRQGSGRADAERAVELILDGTLASGNEVFLVENPDANAEYATRVNTAFNSWFGAPLTDEGRDIIPNIPVTHPGLSEIYMDSAVYGSIITPGTSYVDAVSLSQAPASTTAITIVETYNASMGPFTTTERYSNHFLTDLFSTDFAELTSADYLIISVAVDNDRFEESYAAGGYFRIHYGVHEDNNSDGIVDPDERNLYTHSSNDNAIVSVAVSTKSLTTDSILVFRDDMFTDDYSDNAVPGSDYVIGVRAFTRVIDPWAVVANGATVNPELTITVPGNAGAGFYQGFMKVTGTNGGKTLVPYSYSVPMVTGDYSVVGWTETTGLQGKTLDNDVTGSVDWTGGNGLSGDWRFYDIELSGASVANSLAVEVEWTNSRTVLDLYLFDSVGNVLTTSSPQYIGDGQYNSRSTSSNTISRLLANITDHRLGNILGGENLSGGARFFTVAIHGTSVDALAVVTEPFSIRTAWLTNTVDEFVLPTPVVITTGSATLVDGTPVTSDVAGVSWVAPTANPIPSFTNNLLGMDLTISQVDEVNEVRTLPADTLIPYSSFITAEWTREIVLVAGMEVEATLSWPNQGTDFDLLLVPKGEVIDFDTSISTAAATGDNPEYMRVIVPITGTYVIAVEYFSGDGTDQEFTLDFLAKGSIVKKSEPTAIQSSVSLLTEGVGEATYFIEAETPAWNERVRYSSTFRFDAFSPVLSPVSTIPEQASGDTSFGSIFDASLFSITITKGATVVYELVDGQGITEIIFDAVHVKDVWVDNVFTVTGVDQFGHTIDTSFTVKRRDQSNPILSELADVDWYAGYDLTLTWSVDDATNGTYSVRINFLVWKDTPSPATWTGGNDLALTFNFAETGRYSIVLTLTDINDQRGADTVVVNVGEGEPPTTTQPTSTSSETSTSKKKDSGNDGFLPINLYVMLLAFPVLVYLRRRK